MFKKILSVEDFESASISVQKALKDLKIKEENTRFVNYCDDAFNLLNKSIEENDIYDLLITDLSFEPDFKEQKIKSGLELIFEVRKITPNIKILVFSTEKRPQNIKTLFEDLKIDGFVSKGRMDVKELKKAITEIYKNKIHISQSNIINIRRNDTVELTILEYTLLRLLSEGVLQKNIPIQLKEKDIKPNGLSTVEKTLNQLKETFNAKSNEHLIAICKDVGFI